MIVELYRDRQPNQETFCRIDPLHVKALAFDMQGTLLDFYSTLIRSGNELMCGKGLNVDWTKIPDRWRQAYRLHLDEMIAGQRPWSSTDAIYRMALDSILHDCAWGSALTIDDRDQLSRAWSCLDPWPDTRPGLQRLRGKFKVATLSNGSMASVVNIVQKHDLPFHCVLTSELVRSSKPDQKVYGLAQVALGLRAEEIVMVACHKYDLLAAKRFGFKVAFIPRPLELGPRGSPDAGREDYFDAMAPSLLVLAELLSPEHAEDRERSDPGTP